MDVFEEAWTYFGDVAARVLDEEETKLKRIVRKWCSPSEFDDMYSEVVVWRMARIIETWEEDKGPLTAHVFRSVRWYCFKWIKKFNKHRLPEYIDSPVSHTSEVEVSDLLSMLDEADARIIRQHVIEGYNLQELARAYGVARPTIRKRIDEALGRARTILS